MNKLFILQALIWFISSFVLIRSSIRHCKILSPRRETNSFLLSFVLSFPVSFWAHGIFGDVSLGFPVLSIIASKKTNYNRESMAYLLSNSVLWLLLAASSMGLLWPTLYDDGWLPISIASVCFIWFAIFSVNLSFWLSLAIMTSGVIGFSGFWYTTNTWDFIVDTPFALLSLFLLIRNFKPI